MKSFSISLNVALEEIPLFLMSVQLTHLVCVFTSCVYFYVCADEFGVYLPPFLGSCPQALVWGRGSTGGRGSLSVQLALHWLSWWSLLWTDTDGPAATEPAGCGTWWGSPGEFAPEGHTALWEM